MVKLYLLFDVVAFRLTYPILSKNDCTQALLIFKCPPYSTNMFLLLASNRPLVAAMRICVVIAPPPSLVFKPGVRPKAERAWFLEIALVHMSVCVCVSTPKDINNQWRDIDRVRLVKQVLRLLIISYGNCHR